MSAGSSCNECVQPHFQKSTRLRELLQYIVEQTLHGNAHELTEQTLGNALFHKPSDYSPLEDSSVRVTCGSCV